jgi:hypothetical protein
MRETPAKRFSMEIVAKGEGEGAERSDIVRGSVKEANNLKQPNNQTEGDIEVSRYV